MNILVIASYSTIRFILIQNLNSICDKGTKNIEKIDIQFSIKFNLIDIWRSDKTFNLQHIVKIVFFYFKIKI